MFFYVSNTPGRLYGFWWRVLTFELSHLFAGQNEPRNREISKNQKKSQKIFFFKFVENGFQRPTPTPRVVVDSHEDPQRPLSTFLKKIFFEIFLDFFEIFPISRPFPSLQTGAITRPEVHTVKIHLINLEYLIRRKTSSIYYRSIPTHCIVIVFVV